MSEFFSKYSRLIFISSTLLVLLMILWNTNLFLKEFKREERTKMEVLSAAIQKLSQPDVKDEDLPLLTSIISSNKTIPIIIIKQDSVIHDTGNINTVDEQKLLQMSKAFAQYNPPIHIMDLSAGGDLKLYYGNSLLLNRLQYFPFVLTLIFLLFLATIFQYYKTGKISDDNKLWTGIAKETAHQIGTPLSSLMGWIEMLKTEENLSVPVEELEKDVQRLTVISQRFSKIGSTPVLETLNISEETQKSISYLKARSSNLVQFQKVIPHNVSAKINPQLYSWVIENLVKNAIDAMDGKGKVSITITESKKSVFVDVADTGKGIPASKFKEVFKPGFTTKKRGWGLGLSLVKRIIEQYHDGKIFVKSSKIDEGTVFRIVLKK
jgi:two-component sensor histidine kinase